MQVAVWELDSVSLPGLLSNRTSCQLKEGTRACASRKPIPQSTGPWVTNKPPNDTNTTNSSQQNTVGSAPSPPSLHYCWVLKNSSQTDPGEKRAGGNQRVKWCSDAENPQGLEPCRLGTSLYRFTNKHIQADQPCSPIPNFLDNRKMEGKVLIFASLITHKHNKNQMNVQVSGLTVIEPRTRPVWTGWDHRTNGPFYWEVKVMKVPSGLISL